MEIKNYSDLSDFVFAEYEKLQDFGVAKPPEYVLRAMDRACIKYMKLYSKPLYKKQKAKLKLQEALDTMPHSWLWKKTHARLWRKVQEVLATQENHNTTPLPEPVPSVQNVYPEIYKPIEVPQVSQIEDDND